MATKWASLPASWSNKKKVERLHPAAYSSLTRMLSRAVADTGTNFSIWSALRTHADQVKLFKENYTPAGRGRKLSTDRSYQGKIWKRKPGGVSVASPDLGSNHQDGNAVDIHPGAIQQWIKKNGLLYGWSWDEGKRVGEAWHFRYISSRDQMKGEGRLDHTWVQRVVGAGVDGKIGTGTVAKIKAWQKKNGLTADGKVGPKTKKAMQGKGDATPAPAEGGNSTPAGTTGTAVDGIYPWADSNSQWFGDDFPNQTYKGDTGNKGLLHSTEGSGWPGYSGGSNAPHLTIRFDAAAEKVEARQHFKATRPSRALVNKSGGVQTNNQDVFQIELVGTCDKKLAKKGIPYLPDLLTKPWARDRLAGILAAVSADRDIPLTSTVTWAAYPGSYGQKAKQRLSGTAWTDYAGWLGHQHAPENDHGDPGNIPVTAILTVARGGAAPPDTPSADSGSGSGSSSKLPTGKDLLMALLAAPDFPLLRTTAHRCYYGPKSGPKESVSGHTENSLCPDDVGSNGSEGLKDWQGQMNQRGYSLAVDGKFGDKTEAAAKNLQRLAGLTQDGRIGPDTFYAAWLLPVVD